MKDKVSHPNKIAGRIIGK